MLQLTGCVWHDAWHASPWVYSLERIVVARRILSHDQWPLACRLLGSCRRCCGHGTNAAIAIGNGRRCGRTVMLLCGRNGRGLRVGATDATLLLQRRLERNCIWFGLFGWNFLDTLRVHDAHMIADTVGRILVIRVEFVLVGIVICKEGRQNKLARQHTQLNKATTRRAGRGGGGGRGGADRDGGTSIIMKCALVMS